MNIIRPKGLGLIRLRKLYREAFPKSERKPFSVIRRLEREGKGDILAFYEDGAFLGMATTVKNDDIVLIDYFAVHKKKRSEGYGSRMLPLLVNLYTPRGVFLEIERVTDSAPNSEERERRREFYTRLGFSSMGVFVDLFGVEMELLGYNTTLTYREYFDFYIENIGEFARNHIKEL